MFEYGFIIGRFQPFHYGHMYLVKHALEHVKKLIIICGSSDLSLTDKNPFTFEERKTIIETSLKKYKDRIIIVPLPDTPTDEEWLKLLNELIVKVTNNSKNVALIGHIKDESSYYLKIIKFAKFIDIENYFKKLDATFIRNKILPSIMHGKYFNMKFIELLPYSAIKAIRKIIKRNQILREKF